MLPHVHMGTQQAKKALPALHTCGVQVESELVVTLLRYTLEQVEVPASSEPDKVVLRGAAAGSKASQHTHLAAAKDTLQMLEFLALGHPHPWSLDSQLAVNLYQAISAAVIMNWVSAPHCHCVRPMAVPGVLSAAQPDAHSNSQVLTEFLQVLHAMVTSDFPDLQSSEPELTFMSLMSPQHQLQWPLQSPHQACLHPILNGRFPAWVTTGLNDAWVTTGLTTLHIQNFPAQQVAPPCSMVRAPPPGENVSEGHRLGSMHFCAQFSSAHHVSPQGPLAVWPFQDHHHGCRLFQSSSLHHCSLPSSAVPADLPQTAAAISLNHWAGSRE